jgi:hypothetical protein
VNAAIRGVKECDSNNCRCLNRRGVHIIRFIVPLFPIANRKHEKNASSARDESAEKDKARE